MVSESLSHLAPGTADLSVSWSEDAPMWFTELTPHRDSAASLSIAFDGDDLLSITVGSTCFEIFPMSTVAEDLAYVREIIEAVIRGRVEESGMRGKEFARLTLDSGPISVGAVHAPWPWKARMSRTFTAYAADQ